MRLSLGSGSAFLVEPDFDFGLLFCAPLCATYFSSWTAQIVLVSFFLSVLLVSSPFFQFLQFLCANSKKIKNDFPFLKNPCFLLISSTSSFLMLYIWQIFFFIGHRLNAKRSAPAFHLLTPICPDFSAIAKSAQNYRNSPKAIAFGEFR